MTCQEGSEVVLTCEVSHPDAKVTWTKKGKVIKPDDNCEIIVEGKVHKLIIKHATMDDMAQFTAALDAKQKTACKVTVEGQYQNNNSQRRILLYFKISVLYKAYLSMKKLIKE